MVAVRPWHKNRMIRRGMQIVGELFYKDRIVMVYLDQPVKKRREYTDPCNPFREV